MIPYFGIDVKSTEQDLLHFLMIDNYGNLVTTDS